VRTLAIERDSGLVQKQESGEIEAHAARRAGERVEGSTNEVCGHDVETVVLEECRGSDRVEDRLQLVKELCGRARRIGTRTVGPGTVGEVMEVRVFVFAEPECSCHGVEYFR
jgi:hypothetical protein